MATPFGQSSITSFFRKPEGAIAKLLLIQSALFLLYVFADGPLWMKKYLAVTTAASANDIYPWQPFTAIFLHVHFRDFLTNCLILWFIAPSLQKWWGNQRFFKFWLATSFGGLLLGWIFGIFLGPSGETFSALVTAGALAHSTIIDQLLISGSAGSTAATLFAYAIVFPKREQMLFGVLPIKGKHLGYGLLAFFSLGSLVGGNYYDLFVYLGGTIVAYYFLKNLINKKSKSRQAKSKLKLYTNDNDENKPHYWN